MNTTDRSVSSAAMQHAQKKRAKVCKTANSKVIKAESATIELVEVDGRIHLVVSQRDQAGTLVQVDLSRRAAGRLGRSLIRKDAEICGVAGVRPVVVDSLTLVLLQEAEETISSALERGGIPDRKIVALARSVLRNALCRIETGVSHG